MTPANPSFWYKWWLIMALIRSQPLASSLMELSPNSTFASSATSTYIRHRTRRREGSRLPHTFPQCRWLRPRTTFGGLRAHRPEPSLRLHICRLRNHLYWPSASEQYGHFCSPTAPGSLQTYGIR
ncbi:hypothetical protein EDB85DRAFT_280071 [Lactarius pseudohatsudake]|nr:hypothetical protein EDB85DRAFT_280071 [Lactarius pseudohatsudake]